WRRRGCHGSSFAEDVPESCKGTFLLVQEFCAKGTLPHLRLRGLRARWRSGGTAARLDLPIVVRPGLPGSVRFRLALLRFSVRSVARRPTPDCSADGVCRGTGYPARLCPLRPRISRGSSCSLVRVGSLGLDIGS